MACDKTYSAEYLDGIKDGRAMLTQVRKYDDPAGMARDILANLESTVKGFPASSPVGQSLRGERDFWRNQIKKGLI